MQENASQFSSLKKSLEVRMFNTLHGFNMMIDDDRIIVGLLSSPLKPDTWSPKIEIWPNRESLTQQILQNMGRSAISGLNGRCPIEIDSTYGGYTLEADIWPRVLVVEVIRAVQQIDGLQIKLQNKLAVVFDATTPLYSLEEAEKLYIHDAKGFELDRNDRYLFLFNDERLWKSNEGKRWARHLFQLSSSPQQEETQKPLFLLGAGPDYPLSEELDFPFFSTREPQVVKGKLQKTPQLESKQENPEINDGDAKVDMKADKNNGEDKSDNHNEEVMTCMICLDNPADTMVLPCGHICVCRICSYGLKKSPDAKICVRCRQPIREILADDIVLP